MKIVQAVTTFFPDTMGGMEVYVNGLAKNLKEEGNKVTVAFPRPNAKSEKEYSHEGVSVYGYPIDENATRDSYLGLESPSGTERFHSWIRNQDPDIFHAHGLTAGLHLPELRVARDQGAKVIVTSHLPKLALTCQRGTLMRWGEKLCDGVTEPVKCAECALQSRGLPKPMAKVLAFSPYYFGKFDRFIPDKFGTAVGMKKIIERNIETRKKIFNTVEKYVVLNEWSKKTLLKNGISDKKIAVNRLGVLNPSFGGIERSNNKKSEKSVKVGFLGRITAVKGVYDLAQAITNISTDIPGKFEFRGPGSEEVISELKSVVSSDSRVSFEPPVSPEEVPKVLSEYDVLCCPSRWFEMGPSVMFEAHAVGTPVIGTEVGGMAEVINDQVNGALLPRGDVERLQKLLSRICDNPEVINGWRKNLPEPRTIKDISEDYKKVFKEV